MRGRTVQHIGKHFQKAIEKVEEWPHDWGFNSCYIIITEKHKIDALKLQLYAQPMVEVT